MNMKGIFMPFPPKKNLQNHNLYALRLIVSDFPGQTFIPGEPGLPNIDQHWHYCAFLPYLQFTSRGFLFFKLKINVPLSLASVIPQFCIAVTKNKDFKSHQGQVIG